MSEDIRAFTVLGRPRAKARPRFNSNSKKAYTPKETIQYEDFIRLTYKQQHREKEPFHQGVPLVVTIEAYYKIPKRANKADKEQMEQKGICPTKKPDVDNVVKIILDSLNGIAYHDDSQVVELKVNKFYGSNERVWVQIKKMEEQQ